MSTSKKTSTSKCFGITYPKPLLKWVGGKTQILDTVINAFPKEINNYREIFLGGGSVLLAFLSQVRAGAIQLHGYVHAFDANEPLIYFYKNVQTHPEELYEAVRRLVLEYESCGGCEAGCEAVDIINRKPAHLEEAKTSKESYYYWIRSQYNFLRPEEKKSTTGSAMFLFLNKTCFRGVFRMGPKGFNVPFGHYTNVEIIHRSHLEEIHTLIQNVRFECLDFSASLQTVQEGDFVYLDPPYAPETNTSFVKYTENGFTVDHHHALFAAIHRLVDAGILIMMNNADVPFVQDAFEHEKYKKISILCKRAIHSKKPDTKAKEIIITNYLPGGSDVRGTGGA